jgi:hypothetical protein
MTAIIKRPTMFQLAIERRNVIERIIEQYGEITDADSVDLAAADASIEHKTEAYLAVMAAFEAQRDRANEEAEIARSYASACHKAHDAMRARLAALLKVAGVERVKAANRTVSVQAGRPSVIIDDSSALPLDGKLAKLEIIERVVPDKAAIKEAIDAGITVPGAHVSIGADTIRVTTPRTKAIPATDPLNDRAISSDINAGE